MYNINIEHTDKRLFPMNCYKDNRPIGEQGGYLLLLLRYEFMTSSMFVTAIIIWKNHSIPSSYPSFLTKAGIKENFMYPCTSKRLREQPPTVMWYALCTHFRVRVHYTKIYIFRQSSDGHYKSTA